MHMPDAIPENMFAPCGMNCMVCYKHCTCLLYTSPATAEELRYRVLWKRFYKTIAIAARENPRCRMTHCPKRYWENMLEMDCLLYTSRCV